MLHSRGSLSPNFKRTRKSFWIRGGREEEIEEKWEVEMTSLRRTGEVTCGGRGVMSGDGSAQIRILGIVRYA